MFEKISPEAAGVSSYAVRNFMKMLTKRQMPMHSVLMMKGDKLFAEYYWAPFDSEFCHRMYSQTKSYTAIAVGLLVEDGLVSLDAPMSEYFPEKCDSPLPEYLRSQTVHEMLTMCTCQMPGNWFENKVHDRTHYYFNDERPLHPAGTLWEYDSAGSQVLSSLVEKLSGKSLYDFLGERIFSHLGTFKTAEILKTPCGDSWGDSALVCRPRDMISFARFVMNYGVWNGKRLMNEDYLRLATSKIVDNRESAHYSAVGQGYGYQIWKTEQGGFAFNGMGSQFTICVPEKDIIFVCTGDTQGNPRASNYIFNAFFDCIIDFAKDAPLPEDAEAEAALAEVTSDLKLFAPEGMADSPFRAELDGAVYECEDNPMGITEFSFSFKGAEGGVLRYKNAQGEKELPFGVNRNEFGKFPQLGYSDGVGVLRTENGFMYKDAVGMAWLEEKKILINVQIIDRYFGNVAMFFGFKGDDCYVRMAKTAEDFLDEYQGRLVAHRK